MKKATVTSYFVAFIATLGVQGYPTGAPSDGCRSMLPGHGVPAQTGTTNPYKIMTDKSSFSCPGDKILVTVSGNIFRGFLCQPIPNTGTFEQNLRDPVPKQNKCGRMTSLTHVDNSVKSSISFFWKPQTVQSVNIVCTVVQSKLNFWVNVSSSTMNFVKVNCKRPNTGQETPEQGGSDAQNPAVDITDTIRSESADTGMDRTPDTGINMSGPNTDQAPDTVMDSKLEKGGKAKDLITDTDVLGRDGTTDTKDSDGKNVGYRSSGMVVAVVSLVLCVMFL